MKDVFKDIDGQGQVTSYLQQVLDADRATHAYLLAGAASEDAQLIARRFAAALIAQGDEEVYDEALRGVHPDLHAYTPGGANGYLVEQIRELTHDAELAPIRANKKVYIIAEAHKLTGAPANAFLKTLEEPPGNVTCVLVASSEAAVLETLRSRCEVLSLNTVTRDLAVDTQAIEMVYALSRNCGNRELLANAKRLIEISKEHAHELSGDGADVEEYIATYDDYLSQGAKKQLEQQGKRESTARERAALLDMLAVMRLWLRDCLMLREGAADLLFFPQQERMTRAVADAVDVARVMAALEAVSAAISRFSYNVTPQLAIEAMFLEIREALCRK